MPRHPRAALPTEAPRGSGAAQSPCYKASRRCREAWRCQWWAWCWRSPCCSRRSGSRTSSLPWWRTLSTAPPFCSYPVWLAEPSLACRTWRGLGWTLSPPSSGWSSSATCQDWGWLSSGGHDPQSSLATTVAFQPGPWYPFWKSIAASAATSALWGHVSVRPRPRVCGRCLCSSEANAASLATASCGSLAWAEAALGGGDPPLACVSGTSSAPSDETTRHRLSRSVDDPHVMGWYWFPLRAGSRIASSRIRTPVWNLPPAAGRED